MQRPRESAAAVNSGDYELIVIGAGAAGLAAACTARLLGRRVLLLEHSSKVGGTSALSGGMVWIPANRKMAGAGVADNLENARTYLRQTVPDAVDSPRMQSFLAHGDEAIAFLEAGTALQLRPVKRYPDYYPDLPGATPGARVLEPVPFDARELGKDFRLLRDPLPEFLLFGGMMVSREDLPILRRVTQSPAALWYAAKLLARYLVQRLHAHRGTSLVLGNALVARLLKSARSLGVEIAVDTSVLGLRQRAGRVDGVVLADGSERGASRGVILATGGLSHCAALRPAYVAGAGALSATYASGALRCGAQMAAALGAQLSAPVTGVDDALAFWVPVSRFARADGTAVAFPHTVTDRAKPGLIAVNGRGQRFVNEAVSYHEFVRAQLRDGQRAPEHKGAAWLLCDQIFLWKYGLGRVRPFALSVRKAVASGYLKRADTVQELAAHLGVPAANLLATVETYNAGARHGVDAQFGRGSDIYQRHLGDADCQPNPCVAPMQRAPFFAVQVLPADLGMAAGIMTDAQGRVLGADGVAMAGLYACGNDMHSVMNGAYPGPGITLGPALVFGYLAARHASAQQAETA